MTHPVRKTYDTSIVICDSCKGKGYKVNYALTDYHRNEHDIEKYQCPVCKGTGRLEEKTTKEYYLIEGFN